MKTFLLRVTNPIGPTFRNVLVNTIGFFPFLLFMGLSDGKSLESILPFVCYYTCKVLGIFLIREVKESISSLALLKIALLCGISGSLCVIAGSWYPIFYSFAGILIGLSASWLGAANTAFKQRMSKKEASVSLPLLILAVLLLLMSLHLTGDIRMVSTFFCYFIYFLGAYSALVQVANEQTDSKEKQILTTEALFSSHDFWLFGGMCICLFSLRLGRLLKDGWPIKWALAVFFILFVLFVIRLIHQNKNWQIPHYLNVLAFLNGALGNFLFLFGSLYVVNLFGKGPETRLFYVPYALGMIGSLLTYAKLAKKGENVVRTVIWSVILLGFWSLLIPSFVAISFTLLSYGHFLLNQWVSGCYVKLEKFSIEQRVFIKQTTQSKGALIHQFSLMGLLMAVNAFYQEPFTFFMRITNPIAVDTQAVMIFTTVKFLIVGLFTVIIGWYWYSEQKQVVKG